MRCRPIPFLFLLLAACGPAAAEVPTVRCPRVPPRIRILDLVERWRVSAADEEAPLIGVISRVRTSGPGGDLYLLDRQVCRILIYTADGEFRGTAGAKGDGPGEFRRPYEFEILPDGTLAVRNGWPASLVLLHPDGTPAGDWAPRGALSLSRYRRVPGGWICNGSDRDEEKTDGIRVVSDVFIARFDEEGERVRDYATGESVNVREPPTYDETGPFFPGNRWDLTPAGELVVDASRDAYRLEFLDLEGRLLRVVVRDFAPRRQTEEDREATRRSVRLYRNGVKQEMDFHFRDRDPAIRFVDALPDGSLMVHTCFMDKDLPAGVVHRYDRHAADGTLLEEVRIRGDYDPDYDRLLLLKDGRAVILRNYDANVRSAMNMLEDDDPVREDDVFEIVVCDLVEAPDAAR